MSDECDDSITDISKKISRLNYKLKDLKRKKFIEEHGDLRGNIYQDIDGSDRWVIVIDIVYDECQEETSLDVLEIFDNEIFNITISMNLLMETTQRIYNKPRTKIWEMIEDIIRSEGPLAI